MYDSLANESGSSDVIRDEPSTILGVYEHMHDRVYFICAHHMQHEQQVTRVCILLWRTPLEHARDQPTPHLPHLVEDVSTTHKHLCVSSPLAQQRALLCLVHTCFVENGF